MNAGKTLGGTPTCLVHSQDGNQTGVFTGACRVAPSSGLSSTFVIPLPGESLPAGIEEPKSSNVGVILGASLGALICVSGVVLGFAWYIRRKKVLKERFELIDMEDKPGLSPISVTSERTLASPVSPPASEGGWHHAAPTFPRALSPVTPTTALGSPSTDFADLYRSPPGLPLPFDPRPIPTELHYSAANGQVTVSSGSPLSEYFPPASGPIAAERTVVSLGLPWTDGVEATRPAEIEGEDDKVSRNSVEIPRNSLDGRSEAEDIFADPSEAELEDDDDVAVKIPAGYGVEALDEEDDRDVELATSSMVAASARSSLEKRIV